MKALWQDLRYGLRVLLKHPGFTGVVVLVLALGISANSTIFSVVDAVLLRPFPWKDPDRIVYVFETDLKKGLQRELVSAANFLDWKDQNQSFEQAAAWRFLYFNLTGKDEPERVQGLIVSADFFPLLGAHAAMGRTFLPEEDRPGHNQVVVMSDGLWRRRFGSDPHLIGQKITVEGEPCTVVGILPPDFQMFHVLNRQIDLYQPLALDAGQSNRGDHAVWIYARLKPNVAIEQAQAEMDTIYRRLEREYGAADAGRGVKLLSVPDLWVEKSRPVLLMLLAAVGFVLLIACANIANLLLARATTRQKEMAIRAALGAGRLRLIRQLLTESLLLSLLGGAAGLLLSVWAVDLLNDVIPHTAVNRMARFDLDWRVLGFTLLVSLMTGLIFGLAPALQSSGPKLNESLKEGGKGSGEGMRGGRLRDLLVISEVALSAVLLIGAGLMIKSSLRLQGADRGLNLRNVLTMQIWLPRAKYAEGRQVASFYQQVLRRIETLPGVESASAVNFPPLALQYTTVPFAIEGLAPPKPDELPTAQYSVISPGYFHTMGIPLLTGRPLTEQDADETGGVVVISQSMARRFWPGENPVGRRIKPEFPKLKAFWLPESNNLPLTIVGVVGDVRRDGLSESDLPQMYLPYRQNPSSIMSLLVRTPSDPISLAAAVRGEVYAADKDQPVFDVKTMDDVVAESFSQPRVFTSLLGTLAALALILAAVGVYGVMAYSITRRTHEIGVRVALGGQRGDILSLVMRQGMMLVLAGLITGLTAAFGLTRIMSSMLYGVSATDPVTFVVISLLLAVVGLLACYIPARRATKVDPMVALRCE